MQVTYQLAPEDFYQGCLAWRSRRKWRQWLRWIAYLVVATASLTSLLMLFIDRRAEVIRPALGGVILGAVWFAYVLLAPRFFSRRQFRNHPVAQSPITMDASDHGLEFHNPHANSKVAWSAYVGWGEARSVFIIMPQPRMYITIPKRAFAGEQVGAFREMLRRNIKAN